MLSEKLETLFDLSFTAFTKNGFNKTNFFHKWSAYLDYTTIVPEEIIITGYLYVQLDDPTNLIIRLFSTQVDAQS